MRGKRITDPAPEAISPGQTASHRHERRRVGAPRHSAPSAPPPLPAIPNGGSTFPSGAPLGRRRLAAFNRQLLAEVRQLREADDAGRRWRAKNYPSGYTSYGSVANLHEVSPTFAELAKRIRRHVDRYVEHLDLDMANRELAMTDCWGNMMPRGAVHSLHLHPLALISGTYYLATPPGSAAIKFEDPRLDRFMAQPPVRDPERAPTRPTVRHPAKSGHVVLFESWLPHEVPASDTPAERISISFNYGWF